MNQQLLFAVFLAGLVYLSYYLQSRDEKNIGKDSLEPGKKTFLIEPLFLPGGFLFISLVFLLRGDSSYTEFVLFRFLMVFVNISIYYALLLVLLPFLRKHISARVCASLWIIPSFLYLLVYFFHPNLLFKEPYVVLTLPLHLLKKFFWVWLLGIVILLLWKIASHILYRKFLLKDARKCTQEPLLSLWSYQCQRHGIKKNIPIYLSKKISTPMTLGCFDFTMVLLLPEKNYTEEELTLIFLHELRHILRADTRTKLFVDFFTVMFWFNPLAWIARRKVAEDLELSCDEAVLSDTDEKTRELYAELLLKNAGNSRGYTTQLSSAAGTLRYRLKHVLGPKKRRAAAFLLPLALFLLVMSLFTIAFADSTTTVKEEIFPQIPQTLKITSISTNQWDKKEKEVYGWKEKELLDYLGSLRIKRVYSSTFVSETSPHFSLLFDMEESKDKPSLVFLSFSKDSLNLSILFKTPRYQSYLLEDKIDWDYVKSLMDFDAKDHPVN